MAKGYRPGVTSAAIASDGLSRSQTVFAPSSPSSTRTHRRATFDPKWRRPRKARGNGGVAERESLATSVEIEVPNRWDALALSDTLIPYHSFLVEFDRQRWVVQARVPGNHGAPLDGALGKIKEWLVDRRLEMFRVELAASHMS